MSSEEGRSESDDKQAMIRRIMKDTKLSQTEKQRRVLAVQQGKEITEEFLESQNEEQKEQEVQLERFQVPPIGHICPTGFEAIEHCQRSILSFDGAPMKRSKNGRTIRYGCKKCDGHYELILERVDGCYMRAAKCTFAAYKKCGCESSNRKSDSIATIPKVGDVYETRQKFTTYITSFREIRNKVHYRRSKDTGK